MTCFTKKPVEATVAIDLKLVNCYNSSLDLKQKDQNQINF